MKYAVYVSDDNGWGQDCPDSKSVFFGYEQDWFGGKYYRWSWGAEAEKALGRSLEWPHSLGNHGFVLLHNKRKALALARQLLNGGDWGEHESPVYAVATFRNKGASK